MTSNEFAAQLKKGISGGYLFFGEEEYLLSFYLDRAKKLVLGEDDTLYDFNYYKINTTEDSREALENALSAFPCMAQRTFVEISVDFKALPDAKELLSDISDFDPNSSVVIVSARNFDSGNLQKNRPSELYKLYSSVFVPVSFDRQTPGELRKWIAKRLSREDLRITTDATDLILTRCSRDMRRLSGEIDKLAAYVKKNSLDCVLPEHVELVTVKEDTEEAFALANAIIGGDRKKALSELALCKKRKDAPQMVLGSVAKSVCDMAAVSMLHREGYTKADIAKKLKIHEFRVGLYLNSMADINPKRLSATVSRLREADIKLKTTRLDYIALERFICTIPRKK